MVKRCKPEQRTLPSMSKTGEKLEWFRIAEELESSRLTQRVIAALRDLIPGSATRPVP
jgi:hypothetical protein